MVLLERAIKIGKRFLSREYVLAPHDQQKLIELIREPIPQEGNPLSKELERIEKDIIPFCVNQAHPRYLAFPDSGNSVEGLIADTLKPYLNQNLIADKKSAPIGTYMEIQVIQWFRDMIGYPVKSSFPTSVSEVGGTVGYGGVLSITTALLVARSCLLKDSFRQGVNGLGFTLLVPEGIEHYSCSLAMGYLGLGVDNITRVALNDDYTMNVQDLERQIQKLQQEGITPLAVLAYAGDSRTMRVDDIQAIADVCEHYGIWLHLDACHGGAMLFSESLKSSLDGISRCDSVTLDPHKTFSVPYPCSLTLFKNPHHLTLVSKTFDMTIQENTLDLGQISPFIGSKSFESLKLWLLLKSKGVRGLGRMVDHRHKLALRFKSLLDAEDDLIAMHAVNNNSLCFSFFPADLRSSLAPEEVDSLNQRIHDRIYQDGDLIIHTFKLPDMTNVLGFGNDHRQVLGVIFGNDLTEGPDLEFAISKILRVGRELLEEENEIRI